MLLFCGGCVLAAEAQTGAWIQKSDIGSLLPDGPRGRINAVGFAIGNRGYVGTGQESTLTNTDGQTGDFESYDPATGSWTKRAGFGGAPRAWAAGFSIGGKGYIGTGADSTTSPYRSDFWEYDSATDTWSQKADFGGGARWAAVGFSIGGKGYIGTGSDPAEGDHADLWEYDTAANTWTRKADFGGGARWGAVGFSIDGKGYIGTGNDAAGAYYADFWEYDPAADAWTRRADFGGGTRARAVGFAIGNEGYIGTGNAGIASDGFSTLGQKDLWQYDPMADSWTRKADLPGAIRWSAAGFSVAGMGYIGLGYSGRCYTCGSIQHDFWQYDPGSDSWRQIAGFEPEPRAFATTFSIGSNGYLGLGGQTDLWEYDSAADSWTQKADFPGAARSAAAGFSVGGKGYVATGASNTTYFNDCWQYDPVANTWQARAAFPGAARTYAVAFAVGGKGYVGTGATDLTNNTLVKDLWEYDPAADSWTQKADFGGGTRYQAVAFGIGNYGYIGTGLDTGTYMGDRALVGKKDFWQYDPVADSWTQKADFGGGDRELATGFAAGGNGYIGTGRGDTSLNYLKDFWQYDTAADSWTRIADLPGAGRGMAAAFAIGASGFAGGGNNNNLENDWWEYSPYAEVIRNALGPYQVSWACPGIAGPGFNWETDNQGKLVLGLDAGGNALGATCWGTNTLTADYRNTFGWFGGTQKAFGAYLPRNYVLTPAAEPSSPVTLRLYCTAQELNDFVAGFNNTYGTSYTQADVRVVRYDGVNQDLDLSNNSDNAGDYTSLVPTIGTYGNAGEYRYFEVTTPHLSEFAIALNSATSPLGFTLLNFSAVYHAPSTLLSWETSQEEQTANFQVQRSVDGQQFGTIGNVPAAGHSAATLSYEFTDAAAAQTGSATLYYRLQETDLGGQTHYSPVDVVRIDGSNALSVWPNPATDHVFVQINSATGSTASLIVTDMAGRKIALQALYLQKGNNSVYLETGKWAPGVYCLSIGLDGASWQTKLVKQ